MGRSHRELFGKSGSKQLKLLERIREITLPEEEGFAPVQASGEGPRPRTVLLMILVFLCVGAGLSIPMWWLARIAEVHVAHAGR